MKNCFLEVLNADNDASVHIIDVNNLNIDQVTAKIWDLIEQKNLNKQTENSIERFT